LSQTTSDEKKASSSADRPSKIFPRTKPTIKRPGRKLNCWEYKKCGREPGGVNAEKYGVCSAALETRLDGIHGGKNAGRACWAVAGTYCELQAQGTYAKILKDCMKCDFHRLVVMEEESYQSPTKHLRQVIKEEKDLQHKEPGFLKYVYEKSKRAAEDNDEVDSLFISLLIAFTSFCPSISMLQGSKRLCKDDLVDELWAIDAISDHPKRSAARLFFKTVSKAIQMQIKNYFTPLISQKS
jgi:hypothetical protein